MSIPTWSYDASFYDEKTRGTNVLIKTDLVKGKGLFASRALKAGSIALEETAMCCTQNRDDYLKNVPVCGHCLVSVETPRANVARVTRNKTLAMEIPYSAAFRARGHVRCRYVEQGCPMVFCSTRCQEAAWASFHYANCRGCMNDASQAAYDQFISNDWEQGGVDYSDTHFLSMRFLASAVTLRRLHKASLEASYAHIAQLIKAPITKFHFTFLLRDDDAFPTGTTDSVKERVLWDQFQAFKGAEHGHPHVAQAEASSCTKDDMLTSGQALIATVFQLSEEEKEFYLGTRWSELLGAVLLNGQERTPHSPYYEHFQALASIPSVEQEIRAYHKKVKTLGYNASKLHCSSSGQGIYTIGCLFNHSCDPNLQVLYIDGNDETLVAVCLRDVQEGEELCISYINESLPYAERQQQLYEHYLFDCGCKKCSGEAESATKAIAAVDVPAGVTAVSQPPPAVVSSDTDTDADDTAPVGVIGTSMPTVAEDVPLVVSATGVDAGVSLEQPEKIQASEAHTIDVKEESAAPS
ncbi:Hypothetical protein, putative [Bodo saltans]|uniref:SET domain-containing protein n=1 Tax=Bodo saltans TaxID=75058 RepID=A0A0S4JT57_BODSA|nr:Hypothetical protein, putative [Bodo saltans]|eukprot:CUG93552.1 Hypothetical protein, putative [Bodo saltans]